MKRLGIHTQIFSRLPKRQPETESILEVLFEGPTVAETFCTKRGPYGIVHVLHCTTVTGTDKGQERQIRTQVI